MLLVSRGKMCSTLQVDPARCSTGTSDLRAGRENNNEESTHKRWTGYRLGWSRARYGREAKDESEVEKGERKAVCRRWRDYLRSPRRRRASVMSARDASQSLGRGQISSRRSGESTPFVWIVMRLAWIAHRLQSAKRSTRLRQNDLGFVSLLVHDCEART